MPTKTKQQEVTFIARRRELVLIVQSETRQYFPDGSFVTAQPEKRIEFVDGMYKTADPEAIDWLRSHDLYQTSDGFHEVGNEPDRVPDPAEVLGEVVDLSLNGDVEALQEILEAETVGFQRESVLRAVNTALARIEEITSESGATED